MNIDTLLLIALVLVFLLALVLFFLKNNNQGRPVLDNLKEAATRFEATLERLENSVKDDFARNRQEFGGSLKAHREEMARTIFSFEEKLSRDFKGMADYLKALFEDFGKQQANNNRDFLDSAKDIRGTIHKHLREIRDDNDKQINEMRKTVDEKLQSALEKRLSESFKQVSDRLEQVHKGLGEMQNIAVGVGDLKKVLTNVKTRGVLGEYQLENILEQILTSGQYVKNAAIKKGGAAVVEFAVKLPGKDSEKEVLLPIDSKFPIEDYHYLLDATEAGDREGMVACRKNLVRKIELFAKTISEKYIDPPNTTDFGIMFLPVESLYAEILQNTGLFENLQRKYKIVATGPTTLSALLNSLQMGFRTLAVQKRSSEVWDILKAVKHEFGEFSQVLAKAHQQIDTASNTLSTLRQTRTNVLTRKLKEVESIESNEAKKILETH